MKNCADSMLCCEDPTQEMVTDLLYSIKQEIVVIGKKIFDNMWYGTHYAEDSEIKIRKLNVFHNLLDRLRVVLRNQGYLCLSCHDVQIICEGVRRTIGVVCDGRQGLTIDSTRIAEWTIENPFCVSPERWQRAKYQVCDLIGIKLVRVDEKKACDMALELIQKKIDCEVFTEIAQKHQDCKIKYNIFTDNKTCEAQYEGVLTKKECKAEFKLLAANNSKCDVGFHDYVNIRNCGVDASLIGKIYSCGMSVKFSKTRGCPLLVTSEGKEYYFTDFEVNNDTDLWQKLRNLHIV